MEVFAILLGFKNAFFSEWAAFKLLCSSKAYRIQMLYITKQSQATGPNDPIYQGWATSFVGGPYVGRRSPSQAGLLNGSSSISSTTTIVGVTLIGKQKKRFTHPQMSCFSMKKSKKRSTRLQMSCFVPKILVKQGRNEKF